MKKMFAFKSLMGSISTLSETREQLEGIMQANPMFVGMTEIVEIDYNDAPLTEVGETTKAKLTALFNQDGKKVKNFHAGWGPGFYALSADERMQLLYDILTQVDTAPSNRFPESKQPKVDVRELCARLHDERP